MSLHVKEPAPRDRSLTRAERRRLERGQPLEGEVVGTMGCKFCKSTVGTFYKWSNRFVCRTKDCKGNAAKAMLLGGEI